MALALVALVLAATTGAISAGSTASADGPEPNFYDRMVNFESPWGSLDERTQERFTEATRLTISGVVGGFVAGLTGPVLGDEADTAGLGAGMIAESALRLTGTDRALAQAVVNVPAMAHEAIAVDSEIRHIQAEWKINAVRRPARTVRDAAAEVAETVVDTVDRATSHGVGRVLRNCVRAMFSTRGC